MSDRTYCVSSGCYSDYRVLATFDDIKDAKSWAAALRDASEGDDSWAYSDDARVELLPHYAAGKTPTVVMVYRASVVLWDNGVVASERGAATAGIEARSSKEWSHDAAGDSRPRLRYVRAPCYNKNGGRLEGEGTDERALIQAISDRAAMFKAGAWNPKRHTELTWVGTDDPTTTPPVAP